VSVFKRGLGDSEQEGNLLNVYRIHLAITISATPFLHRKYVRMYVCGGGVLGV